MYTCSARRISCSEHSTWSSNPEQVAVAWFKTEEVSELFIGLHCHMAVSGMTISVQLSLRTTYCLSRGPLSPVLSMALTGF